MNSDPGVEALAAGSWESFCDTETYDIPEVENVNKQMDSK